MRNNLDIQNQSQVDFGEEFFDFLEQVYTHILSQLNHPNKPCELLFVNNQTIQSLNAQYRNQNSPTDVLSFPFEGEFSPLLGSVVISVEYAQNILSSYTHSLNEEITLLFVHGILHLLGFDHECDKGEHRQKEEEILHFFNLPMGLIPRTNPI